MARRDKIMEYVTKETAPKEADLIQRAFDGRLFDAEYSERETIAVLLRTVQALYKVDVWLADELDKVEAAVTAR